MLAIAPALLLQTLLGAGAPIRFAPSLVLVLLAAWWWGLGAGLAATLTASYFINFLFLEPQYTWSHGQQELTATGIFALLGVGTSFAVNTVRKRFDHLHVEHHEARRVSQEQESRLVTLEADFQSRLTLLRKDFETARGHANAYERIQRYVSVVESRLAELQAAFDEFPVPLALIAHQEGLPELRAASVALYEFGNSTPGQEKSVRALLGAILTERCEAFAHDRHPFSRALKGETVKGELVVWLKDGQMQAVQLYAKPVAGSRMLAIALLPLPQNSSDRSLN